MESLPTTTLETPAALSPSYLMQRDPAHTLWHTPELLTMILEFLPDPVWTRDVASTMRTSKYGLEVGMGVLYVSEKEFPAELGRSDMEWMLEEACCPETRKRQYLSKVRHLTYHDDRHDLPCQPPDTELADLHEWLAKTTTTYPSATSIGVRVAGAVITMYRGSSGAICSLLVVDTREHEAREQAWTLPQFHRRVVAQLGASMGDTLPYLHYYFGEDDLEVSGGMSMERILDLGNPGQAYDLLSTLDLGGTNISRSTLIGLIRSSPVLRNLWVKSDDLRVPITDEEYYEILELKRPLSRLTIAMTHGSMSFIMSFVQAFQWLDQLTFCLFETFANDYTDVNPPDASLPNLGTMEVLGDLMSGTSLLQLLDLAPQLVSLGFVGRLLSGKSMSDTSLLENISSACPNLTSLYLSGGDRDYFPFPGAIDILVFNCPDLEKLTIPVYFRPTGMPIRLPDFDPPEEDRWPELNSLKLYLLSSDGLTQPLGFSRPPTISVAYELFQYLGSRSYVTGAANWESLVEEEKLRAEYWWLEVVANLRFMVKQAGMMERAEVEGERRGWEVEKM